MLKTLLLTAALAGFALLAAPGFEATPAQATFCCHKGGHGLFAHRHRHHGSGYRHERRWTHRGLFNWNSCPCFLRW